MGELGHELWVGDAARIRASEVRQQKTDARDAELLLDLLRTGRFPRIWVPSLEERDLRQLLVHRMKLVRARTQVKNQLHAPAMSQEACRKGMRWSAEGRAEIDRLALLPWAARRRKERIEWLDHLDEQVRELVRAVEEARRARPGDRHVSWFLPGHHGHAGKRSSLSPGFVGNRGQTLFSVFRRNKDRKRAASPQSAANRPTET